MMKVIYTILLAISLTGCDKPQASSESTIESKTPEVKKEEKVSSVNVSGTGNSIAVGENSIASTTVELGDESNIEANAIAVGKNSTAKNVVKTTHSDLHQKTIKMTAIANGENSRAENSLGDIK